MAVSSSPHPAETSSSAPRSTSASEHRYTGIAVALHWAVAALVIVQVALGWAMQEIAKQPPGPRAEAFNVHKSIGLTLFALMLFRLGWRLFHPPPPLPPMPRWQRLLANGNHALLYAALLVMPVAGYLGSVFSGYPVKAFGVTLPSWGGRNDAVKSLMSAVHLGTSWVLVAAIALHIAGVVKHAFVERDALVRRMWPFPARDSGAAGRR